MTDADRFHIPPQVGGIDISPLVAIIDREMQRLRDQLAVERSATSSAREALAACEERLKAANEARLAAVGEANRYAVERDNAVAELERCKSLLSNAEHVKEQAVEECRQVGIRSQLLTGTVPAVLEAYRLLVGDSLEWSKQVGWFDNTKCDSDTMEEATHNIIQWLDVYAPGGVK